MSKGGGLSVLQTSLVYNFKWTVACTSKWNTFSKVVAFGHLGYLPLLLSHIYKKTERVIKMIYNFLRTANQMSDVALVHFDS